MNGQPAEQRPKWFQFCTITTMVLGALGALAGLWAPINLYVAKNNPFTSGMPAGPGMPPEMVEFQEKLMAAALPEVTALIGVLNLATGAWALWAALQLMKLQPGAREKFRNAVLALGAYEVIAMLFAVIMQARMFSVMEELMGTIVRGSGGASAPAGFEQTMTGAMRFGMIIGLLTAVVWGGCKIAFAFWARGYAAKREVIAYVGDT